MADAVCDDFRRKQGASKFIGEGLEIIIERFDYERGIGVGRCGRAAVRPGGEAGISIQADRDVCTGSFAKNGDGKGEWDAEVPVVQIVHAVQKVGCRVQLEQRRRSRSHPCAFRAIRQAIAVGVG